MAPVDIAVIVVVSAAFAVAVGLLIWRKVKHKGGCDCGCTNCPSCSSCNKCGKSEKQD